MAIYLFSQLLLILIFTFLIAVRRFPLWISSLFLPILFIQGVLFAFYGLITRPAFDLICLSLTIIPMIFFAWVITGAIIFPQLDDRRVRAYTIGGFVVVLSQFSPILENMVIKDYCDKKITRYSDSIITTIRQYKLDKGVYPHDMKTLIPDYLPGYPTYSCLNSDQLGVDFYIEEAECGGNYHLSLTIEYRHSSNILSGSKDYKCYNLETGEWSIVDGPSGWEK